MQLSQEHFALILPFRANLYYSTILPEFPPNARKKWLDEKKYSNINYFKIV